VHVFSNGHLEMIAEKIEPTKAGIGAFIIDSTNEYWASNSQPYLLGWISPALKLHAIDYREIIAPHTLKEFVSTLSESVTMVIHPEHKSKIGLIPMGESFSFEPDSEAGGEAKEKPSDTKRAYRSPRPKFAVLNFLEALSKLTPEELSSVSIPISVLVKIVGSADEEN